MVIADITPRLRLPRGVRQTYSYTIPDTIEGVASGQVVLMPFRRRRLLGVVERTSSQKTGQRGVTLKPLQAALPYHLTPHQRWLLRALERVYGATRTQALTTVLPELLRRPETTYRTTPVRSATVRLTAAEDRVRKLITQTRSASYLTGRLFHPTEKFFLELARETLTSGQQALYLFPDQVSLAATYEQYLKVFGDAVVCSHGSSGSASKTKQWLALQAGNPQLVLGTRSALFLSFSNLRRIVIFDAAYEAGYSSWDMQPHYDAVALACQLSKRRDVQLLATSTLPSLRFGRSTHAIRWRKHPRTPITILDRRSTTIRRSAVLHPDALDALAQSKNRALVFVNRRGYAALLCRACEYLPRCPNCDRALSLTTHKQPASLLHCFSCNRDEPVPSVCTQCGSADFAYVGAGIERVTRALTEALPGRTIIAVSAEDRASLERINDAESIVVATSAILPRLWLLGTTDIVIAVRPEVHAMAAHWDAMEQTLHELATLHALAAKHLYIDTSLPDHRLIQAVVRDHYHEMLRDEDHIRRRFHYPPYGTLVRFELGKGITPQQTGVLLDNIRLRGGESAEQRLATGERVIVAKFPASASLQTLWPLVPRNSTIDLNPTTLV